MQLSDYYALIVAVFSIAGVIIVVRIFFTLWAPLDRRINGDKLALDGEIHIDNLKNKSVNIHLKSGTTLDGVMLLGYCTTHFEAPYNFKQLMTVRLPDGRTAYIRIEEIEYLEEQHQNA